MSQPRVSPVEKTIQQKLDEIIYFIEKNYGLDAQSLTIALVVILITLSK